ncbi:transcriptional regulator [Algivirga pacifica]|uniref:Transcriptional regulator n=1 Tax=Algivirga pacifica TaxID=1162670 RepID=A0ABP9D8M4_9BACT
MKVSIENINKAFESRIRLGMMSVLMANEEVDFKELKRLLQLTDGNLASHAKALEKEGFIEVEKKFIGRKPNTTYRATELGKEEFAKHLEALEQLIKGNR